MTRHDMTIPNDTQSGSPNARFLLGVVIAIAGMILTGCGQGSVHSTRGVVREFPADGSSVVIRHEEIPGFMPKMTMMLRVRDTNELAGIREGDEVEFRLHVAREEHWIDAIRKVGRATNKEPPGTLESMAGAELANGDLIPDLEITDEEGESLRLSGYRGRAVALTFIFTRCPLPEFCPRMSKEFARAHESLLQEGPEPDRWQLLSLSFDPEFDTPKVLRRHAQSQRRGEDRHWRFGALSQESLRRAAPLVGLRVQRDEGGISHNLRTVVLDARGRIHLQLDGNSWSSADLVRAVREAASIR
ncbi:MAG: SCO family protein [Verrucomicrobiota bacterium]